MSYTIKFYWEGGDVLSGEQEIVTKAFLERLDHNISVYNRKCLPKDEFFVTRMELKLDFLFG